MAQFASELDEIVSQIADRTGVNSSDVKTILSELGIEYAVASIAKIAGVDKLSTIGPENVVVGIRYENALVAK